MLDHPSTTAGSVELSPARAHFGAGAVGAGTTAPTTPLNPFDEDPFGADTDDDSSGDDLFSPASAAHPTPKRKLLRHPMALLAEAEAEAAGHGESKSAEDTETTAGAASAAAETAEHPHLINLAAPKNKAAETVQTYCIKKLDYITDLMASRINTTPAGQKLVQHAVLRTLEEIGEAAKTFGDPVQETNPHIPWFTITHLRDLITHSYFLIARSQDMMDGFQAEIPELKIMIESLKFPTEKTTFGKRAPTFDGLEALQREKDDGLGLEKMRNACLNTEITSKNPRLKGTNLRLFQSRVRLCDLDLSFIRRGYEDLIRLRKQHAAFSESKDPTTEEKSLHRRAVKLNIEFFIAVMGQAARELKEYHNEWYVTSWFKPLQLNRLRTLRNDCMHSYGSILPSLRERLEHTLIADAEKHIATLDDVLVVYQQVLDQQRQANEAAEQKASAHVEESDTSSSSSDIDSDSQDFLSKISSERCVSPPCTQQAKTIGSFNTPDRAVVRRYPATPGDRDLHYSQGERTVETPKRSEVFAARRARLDAKQRRTNTLAAVNNKAAQDVYTLMPR